MEVYTDGPVLPEGNNLKIRTPEPHPDDTDFYYTLGGDTDDLVLVTYPEWDNSDLDMIESRLAEVSNLQLVIESGTYVHSRSTRT